MSVIIKVLPLFIIYLLFSCNNHENIRNKSDQIVTHSKHNKNLTLIQYDLKTKPIEDNVKLGPFIYADSELKFIIQNATLGIKTEFENDLEIQNSSKGLYLHIVLNDTLHIVDSYRLIPCKLKDGDYQMIAFLSKSFHETIKNPISVFSRKFTVLGGKTVKSYPLENSAIAIAAPYGTYKKDESENILLDFALANTKIAKDSNKILIRIDSENEFTVFDWKSYFIQGLEPGYHSVELELQNRYGQKLYGPVVSSFEILK